MDCGGSDNITIGVLETKQGDLAPLPEDVRTVFLAEANAKYVSRRQPMPAVKEVEEAPSSRQKGWILLVLLSLILAYFAMS